MMPYVQLITGILGIFVPMVGIAFWLGKLQGRVSELTRENKEMEIKCEKLERSIERNRALSDTQIGELRSEYITLSNGMSSLKTSVSNINSQISALFTKVDSQGNQLLKAVQQLRKS